MRKKLDEGYVSKADEAYINLSLEAQRLMKDHRSFFHELEKKDCKICRSFRRTILKGLSS